MIARIVKVCSSALAAVFLTVSGPAVATAGDNGVIKFKSVYHIEETITRLKQDIEGKGITFFTEIDQSKLAADAGIKLKPSVLVARQSG